MKAYRYDSSKTLDGAHGAAIGLSLVEAETPRPGSGQVLMRVKANSLNFVDLISLSGAFPVDGLVPLLDGAGVVEAVGEGVTRWRAGDRVVANPNLHWLAGEPAHDTSGAVLGITTNGMLAETVIMPEGSLVALPETISFEAGASLPCAGLSAWNSLMGGPTRRGVVPGDTILTLGTGGVSLFAVQFARAMGCRVIATTSSSDKAARLKALGADVVINYRETPEWGAAVLDATQGLGVDLVVEVGGPNTLPQSIQAAKVGGRIALIGIVGGMGSLDYAHMLPIGHKILTVFANGMGSRRDLEAMMRFVEIAGIAPVIDSTFGFAKAEDAFRHYASRQHIGKVVIAQAASNAAR
ncbi:zinc-dependent alcohol dehydrogenase family protein [Sphingomonas sp. KC8]|uniref:zinc-dependent alcohol dehydrogenase family protein n=1 Tax=Sphingomonas sp. KC8 TaxID=1030157 RepID=UPI00024889E8|nr:NAD(P)-dependent alcohol dehydrogenase [Sphingomonas sp. KC8]ARS26099.1 oxidoreductase [Sphingomonas sp. KC8]